jgi:hypothetical protein
MLLLLVAALAAVAIQSQSPLLPRSSHTLDRLPRPRSALVLGVPPREISPAAILDTIADLVPGRDGVLVGMVNIHTHQAEMLIHHFAELLGPDQDDELAASRDPARLPVGTQRVHRAASRRRTDPSVSGPDRDDG